MWCQVNFLQFPCASVGSTTWLCILTQGKTVTKSFRKICQNNPQSLIVFNYTSICLVCYCQGERSQCILMCIDLSIIGTCNQKILKIFFFPGLYGRLSERLATRLQILYDPPIHLTQVNWFPLIGATHTREGRSTGYQSILPPTTTPRICIFQKNILQISCSF